ncbi:hypothetical protein MFIFM68171_01691 [Madurella fahalii]|uniref:Uncharacterized protein n=1 Tax=Madurella fahalii TaxID=1157608 RepID=A0ABQ0G157_9PEZI
MLESGGHGLHPDQLELVTALAADNSIYTAEYLIHGPSIEDRSGSRRFLGIGRIFRSLRCPGTVLLIPPADPLLMQVNSSFSQAETFDGEPRDRFEQTSLHLKFTPYILPPVTTPGAINSHITLREALISIFDGAKWVADLDLLTPLSHNGIRRFKIGRRCGHEVDKDAGKLGRVLAGEMGGYFKSVKVWEELLVCKEYLLTSETGIIREHGNWYVRLAATSLY